MNSTIEVKLASIPAGPGVYVYKDAAGIPIYVGKARSLRSRVRSYFQDSRDLDPRLSQMLSSIGDVEFVVTDTEGEALALENNLVEVQDRPHPRLAGAGRRLLCRAVLPRRARAKNAALDRKVLPDTELHDHDRWKTPASLPAVLHPQVPRSMR